jgi:hypothetical protein
MWSLQVRIIDFDPVRFINFEAEINYPVEDGIIQVPCIAFKPPRLIASRVICCQG